MRRSTKAVDNIEHVKTVRPKRGRGAYYYFDTGRRTLAGGKIYVPLPDRADKSFWPTYSALCAGRTKRDAASAALTLSDLMTLYRKSKKFRDLKPGSQKIYDIYLRQISAAFPGAPADDVQRKDMQILVDTKADKPGAANMIIRIGSALFDWAVGREYAPLNPCTGIDLNELGEHEPWPDHLLTAALDSEDALVRLAVHLLYYTGQRIGDVTMMRWTDIRNGRMEIVQEKTGKFVSIPLHPSLRTLLDKTPRQALAILSRQAQPVERGWLREECLQPWAEALGHDIVPHGLRKNAVNALLEAGCATGEVSAITGHSLQMVEHYAKRRDNRKLADSAVLKWSGEKR